MSSRSPVSTSRCSVLTRRSAAPSATFRSGAADQDGQYKISAIIPGNYLLLTWPESDVARVQDPELFAQLEDYAVSVTVDKSATVRRDLTLTEDIQTIVGNFVQ